MLRIEIKGFIFHPIWKVHNQFSIILSSVDKMADHMCACAMTSKETVSHHQASASRSRSNHSSFYLYLWNGLSFQKYTISERVVVGCTPLISVVRPKKVFNLKWQARLKQYI